MLNSMQIPVMMGSDRATQKLIAPIQEDLTAVQAYAVGEMFIFNNVLYKATSAISLGDTIAIGTNADVAGTIADAYGAYGRGLKSTSTWSDAYSKAQSFIIVNFVFVYSTVTREVNILVLKDNIESTEHYVTGTGGAFSSGGSNLNVLAQVAVSTSGISNYYLFVNSTNVVNTATIKYFYD